MKRVIIFSIILLGVVSAIIWATTREPDPPQQAFYNKYDDDWDRDSKSFGGPGGPDFDPDEKHSFGRGPGGPPSSEWDKGHRGRREWFERQKERWEEEAEFRGDFDKERGPRWGEFYRESHDDWFGPEFFRGGKMHGRPPVEHLANSPEAMEKLREHFPKMAKLIEETANNRDEARKLLEQYHSTTDQETRDQLVTKIRPLLEREFELELMRQRIEIEFLEKKLSMLKEVLEKREAKAEEFKELHIRRILELSSPEDANSIENDPRTGAADETDTTEAQPDPQDQQ